ncbi:hybrid NRPS/PKS enzyme [Penicillium longicatenatum]|nr:hybrid NRPS/PKS enzyme [Penicillium longicatenatum]
MGIDTKKDLVELFAHQVRATPDAIALEDDTIMYTYGELDKEANSLTHRLLGYGVERDRLVGVLLPRSANYVIACIATLRAGGAFLVLESAYPPDLLADVIDDAKPVIIVTSKSESVKVKADVPLLIIDDDTGVNEDTEGSNADSYISEAQGDHSRLAFVAYSSGTTGKPKGIANPHQAAVLSYNLRFDVQDVQPGDRVACNVFFVWEILRPLIRGATVVAVPDEVSYDPAALVDLLSSQRITETLMTPTLLAAVLSRHPDIGTRLPDLRTLWLNGEVVTTDLAARAIKALPNTRLLNCYSTCEAHEIACGDIRDMFDKDATYCPVGTPLYPDQIYILDEKGHRVEEGIRGELFIGGPQLARGYLNRPETTAKSFKNDIFNSAPGARMHKSGDLARILPSGYLEITGRVSGMIKLRGYSVVPGQVEKEIVRNFAVSHCAVIAHGEGLERQLVAYFVRDKNDCENRPAIEINESGHSPVARRTLLSFLAHYMIPAIWVEMDEFPTHEVSGKVDLKRLPPPRAPRLVNGIGTKEDSIRMEDVAAIWEAVLKTPKATLRASDDFFDLGGHSLSLADLSSRLSRHFGFRVPITRLAENSTLNGQLLTVRAVRDGHTAEVQADLPAVLCADSVLDVDITPCDTKICPIDKATTILLTGATGFLGAFLLHDLLEATSAKIICLVRFTDPNDDDKPAAGARIRRNLLDLGLWNDSVMERVEVLSGNLSRRRLGLSSDSFDDLASRVDVIVHAAATVNLVYPYAALRNANVGGTREILRLACKGGATVQYVSTNGVLPPSGEKGWDESALLSVDEVTEKLHDGYGQTKWVAEQLVLEAGRRGLPVKIYRAGTISSHSVTGASNPYDLLTALIVESIQLGYAPAVDGWRAEMTPVDFTSKAIIHLANLPNVGQTVFHLGDPNPVNIDSVFLDLALLGYPTERLEWEAWIALWTERRGSLRGGDGAFAIDVLRSGMPSIGFLEGIVVLNNASTRPFRAEIERPEVDSVLLETYTRHWFARGWLSHPPSRQLALGGSANPTCRGPLSGRVAVITGASSGIGAAVATALAREGCHVALAARRLDALTAIKRRLVVREGKVMVRQTDVTERSQVTALMQAARDELGPIDILISCAGVMYFTMMSNAQIDEWERTVDVNCKGLLNCLSSTVPDMVSRGGHIVAISSDAGRKVFPGLGVYSASKFFVEATLQSLRLETAGTGLRVTSIQPGNTATDLLGMSTDTEAVKKYGLPSGAKILDSEDIANSVVYALRQPAHVAVNEVLIEPRDEPI